MENTFDYTYQLNLFWLLSYRLSRIIIKQFLKYFITFYIKVHTHTWYTQIYSFQDVMYTPCNIQNILIIAIFSWNWTQMPEVLQHRTWDSNVLDLEFPSPPNISPFPSPPEHSELSAGMELGTILWAQSYLDCWGFLRVDL